MTRTLAASLLLVGSMFAASFAGDWPCFRGPTHNGYSSEKNVPVEWNLKDNVKWKIELPGTGNGSPIVVGDRVLLAIAQDEGAKRGLYCYDAATGKLQWSHDVAYETAEITHKTNPYCGSTPASDGKRVVVWHGSAGVFCYSLDGKELWNRDLGTFRHIWGYGSSPILHDGKVYLNCGPGKRSFVTALDLETGKTVWQVDDPKGNDGDVGGNWTGSWATPVLAKVEGKTQVVVSLPGRVQAFDPATGDELWKVEGLGKLAYIDTLVGDGYGVAMSGYHGPAIGFKLGGSGDMTNTNRLWHATEKNPQRIGSGIVLGERLFMVNEQAIVQCLDMKTGKEIWKDRMPNGGTYWASLVYVDGRLYATNKSGKITVLAPNPEKLEILAENQVGEGSNATPAFANGEIFHRTFGSLMCIVK
jgi:outer membrane protein assembly factor BamB